MVKFIGFLWLSKHLISTGLKNPKVKHLLIFYGNILIALVFPKIYFHVSYEIGIQLIFFLNAQPVVATQIIEASVFLCS